MTLGPDVHEAAALNAQFFSRLPPHHHRQFALLQRDDAARNCASTTVLALRIALSSKRTADFRVVTMSTNSLPGPSPASRHQGPFGDGCVAAAFVTLATVTSAAAHRLRESARAFLCQSATELWCASVITGYWCVLFRAADPPSGHPLKPKPMNKMLHPIKSLSTTNPVISKIQVSNLRENAASLPELLQVILLGR